MGSRLLLKFDIGWEDWKNEGEIAGNFVYFKINLIEELKSLEAAANKIKKVKSTYF